MQAHAEHVERRAFSPREVALRLGVGQSLVDKAIRNGTLPSVKLGRRRLVPADAVEELLSAAAAQRDGGGRQA